MDQYGNLIATFPSYGAGINPAGYTAPWHLVDGNVAMVIELRNAASQATPAISLGLLELLEEAQDALCGEGSPDLKLGNRIGKALAAHRRAAQASTAPYLVEMEGQLVELLAEWDATDTFNDDLAVEIIGLRKGIAVAKASRGEG